LGGTPPGGPGGADPTRLDPTLDPLTGESTKDDWSFQIEMDVVLKDLPEKPAEEGAPTQP
jgi:hypothetical protein